MKSPLIIYLPNQYTHRQQLNLTGTLNTKHVQRTPTTIVVEPVTPTECKVHTCNGKTGEVWYTIIYQLNEYGCWVVPCVL